MSSKEKYREEFLAGRRLPTAEEHLAALDDLPDLDWATIYGPMIVEIGRFRVDIPYDLSLLKEFRRSLGNLWSMKGKWGQGDGDGVYEYTHNEVNVELQLVLRLDVEGATCERIRVGEEAKMVAIYEVRCGGEKVEVPDE